MSSLQDPDNTSPQTTPTGSTDAGLAAARKSAGGPGGNKRTIIIVGIAVVAVIAVVLAIVLPRVLYSDKTQNGAAGQTQDQLTIGAKLAPTNLDIRNQSGAALDQILIDNIYEPLVGRNANNVVVPLLAKEWEVSDDALTYTFQLNDNLRFSNGHILDSADVVWSLNQLLINEYSQSDLLRNIDSIGADGTHTVVIKLTAPYSDLLWALSGRPGLVFDSEADYDPKTQAIGSGPYLLASFSENESITLKRNNEYWGSQKATIPTIVVRYYADDNAALNAFKSGSTQVLAPVMNAKMTDSLQSDDRFTVKQGEGTDKYVLAMNHRNEVFSDIRVRQAIRSAINHEEIIASRGGVDAPLGGPIPSLDPGYEDLTDLYPYDPGKARELLTAAGYTTDNPLTLRLEYANTYGPEFGEQLKSQLARVGITLDVKVVEFSTWLQDVYINHDYDLSLVDHNESHDFYQWADPDYYYGYDSPEVQKLYQQSIEATDAAEQDELLKQAARIVSEDAAADWLLNYRVTTAFDKGVTNFPLNLNQSRMPLAKVDYRK